MSNASLPGFQPGLLFKDNAGPRILVFSIRVQQLLRNDRTLVVGIPMAQVLTLFPLPSIFAERRRGSHLFPHSMKFPCRAVLGGIFRLQITFPGPYVTIISMSGATVNTSFRGVLDAVRGIPNIWRKPAEFVCAMTSEAHVKTNRHRVKIAKWFPFVPSRAK